MDIKDIKADMSLNQLYFSSIKFSRKEKLQAGEYEAEITRSFEKVGDEYVVTMPIKITKKDFSLSMTAIGHFSFTTNIEDIDARESMIRTNAAAIMFPFVRSQVSLVTTQPGMAPILLPAINVTKMTE